MAGGEGGEKTEAPTDKRRRDSAEKGDVLQSRELGTALVMVAGAAWLALAGPWAVGAMEGMLRAGLTFDARAVEDFDPGRAIVAMLGAVAAPVAALFALTILAAIAAPAVLGSLSFRWGAIGFKADKLNPLSGLKRIVGVQGLMELGKSLLKVVLLGAVGLWVIMSHAREIVALGADEIGPALGRVGAIFTGAVLALSFALAGIALLDVPAQVFQRGRRLRMTKQEVKDEGKEAEGSPEVKAQIRRRQHEQARNSARSAVKEANVVLVNPSHFAVALRYRPGQDAAPILVARGADAAAQAIRELADEHAVPVLRYPALTRALYFTTRSGAVIREDLYLAVATVLAFVFSLDAAMRAGARQPRVEVPPDARFDADGRPAPDADGA